jgi:hypothetical protein
MALNVQALEICEAPGSLPVQRLDDRQEFSRRRSVPAGKANEVGNNIYFEPVGLKFVRLILCDLVARAYDDRRRQHAVSG